MAPLVLTEAIWGGPFPTRCFLSSTVIGFAASTAVVAAEWYVEVPVVVNAVGMYVVDTSSEAGRLISLRQALWDPWVSY